MALRISYYILLILFIILPIRLVGQDFPMNTKASVDSLNALAQRHSVFEENSRNTTLRYASEALVLAEKIGYKYGMLQALDVITYWTIIVGNIEEALVYGFRQLRLAEEVGQQQYLARALRNVGFAAGQQTKSDSSTRRQAKAHLKQALAIALSIRDTVIESACLNSLGRLSRLEKDWTNALEFHEKALRQARAIRNPEQESWALYSIGVIYETRQIYDSAMFYVQQSLAIRAAAKQNFGEAVSLRLIALLHFRQKNYSAALQNIQQSIAKCRGHEGLFIVKVEAYRLLIAICKEIGDAKGELEAYRNFVAVKDSADATESQKSVGILQARLEIEHQESEKKILLRDKQIQEIRIQRQRIIGMSIIGSGLILIIVIIYLVRTARIKKKQHAQLREAYQEIQRQKDILESQAEEIEITNTQLQEINAVLQQSNRELDEANDFKMRMLSIASHDLKNPLHLVAMLSDLLMDPTLTKEQIHEFAQKIHQTSIRTTELVRDLLDIAAQELGKMTITREALNMTDVVRSVIEQYQIDAEEKHQHIIFEGEESEHWLEGDVKKLYQVAENLLSNAVKYSPLGKTITVRLFEQQSSGTIVLCVEDEGPGLSDEDKEKAFTLFQRLSAKTTGGESSSGVGLALVKTIVNLHNGSVRCESELGQGATFIVELPKQP